MILTKAYPTNGHLNNLIDELFSAAPYNWAKEKNNTTTPAVNILETAEGYHLELNVPGRAKEDFTINVENGVLTIGYEKKEQAENKDVKTIRREFSFGSFKRSFTLDEKIDAEGINARYENGLLKLFVPKKEEVKVVPKQIQVQ